MTQPRQRKGPLDNPCLDIGCRALSRRRWHWYRKDALRRCQSVADFLKARSDWEGWWERPIQALHLQETCYLHFQTSRLPSNPPADFIIKVSVSLIMAEGPQGPGDSQRQFSVILFKLPLPLRPPEKEIKRKEKKEKRKPTMQASVSHPP